MKDPGRRRHREFPYQARRASIRARAALVEARTMLINFARGITKTMGHRLPSRPEAEEGRAAGSRPPAAQFATQCRHDLILVLAAERERLVAFVQAILRFPGHLFDLIAESQ